MSLGTRFVSQLVAIGLVSLPAICSAIGWPTKCSQRAYACASVAVRTQLNLVSK